jgi:hypothetical protein
MDLQHGDWKMVTGYYGWWETLKISDKVVKQKEKS